MTVLETEPHCHGNRKPVKAQAAQSPGGGSGCSFPRCTKGSRISPGGQSQPLQHWLTNLAKLSGLSGLGLFIANGRDEDATTEGCQVEESR